MNPQVITDYFLQYGVLILFIIVFLEYLNLPGFPAGVIMPLAGIWASKGEVGIITTIIISVIAGLCGSWLLYAIGYFSGDFVIKKYIKWFPKQKATIEKVMERIHSKGCAGIFVTKLIPVIRTIIGLPAGVVRMNFIGYTVYSTLGILVWNTVFIGAGFFFGETILASW